MAMDKELDSLLRSNCTLSVVSFAKLAKTSDDVKTLQRISSTRSDLRPQKLGEIFRNKLGEFSFLCTHCDTIREHCQEIMDHINSHFEKENSFTHHNIEMSPLMLPEFVSTGHIKLEPDLETTITPNDIFQTHSNVQSLTHLKPITKTDVLKTEIEEPDSEGCRSNVLKQTAEKSNSLRKPPVIKIIKLKPVKIRARNRVFAEKSKTLNKVIQKNETKDCKVKLTPDTKSIQIQNTPTVRIIKLKPVKFPPRDRTIVEKSKSLDNVDQKNSLPKPADLPIIKTPSEVENKSSQGSLQPTDKPDPKLNKSILGTKLNHKEPQKQYVNVPQRLRYKCYQCEMEPLISNPSHARRHICLFCNKWLSNHIEFEVHVRAIHKKNVNYVCSKDFYCYKCEKKFPFRQYLVNHLKVHSDSTDHLCSTCGSTFKTNKRLVEHMKRHDDRTYECQTCGKVFQRFDRLRQHLWCHNTELSFVCEVCSKAFKMKRYLNRHMAVHNEAKIYCRHCDASFNFVSVRRAHEISRHNVV